MIKWFFPQFPGRSCASAEAETSGGHHWGQPLQHRRPLGEIFDGWVVVVWNMTFRFFHRETLGIRHSSDFHNFHIFVWNMTFVFPFSWE